MPNVALCFHKIIYKKHSKLKLKSLAKLRFIFLSAYPERKIRPILAFRVLSLESLFNDDFADGSETIAVKRLSYIVIIMRWPYCKFMCDI